jgi:hypothetical protein
LVQGEFRDHSMEERHHLTVPHVMLVVGKVAQMGLLVAL